MLSHREFHSKRMLAVIGEALLNIGTIEYKLSCAIPRLQSYFGMTVSRCYHKSRIPSLNEQNKPCQKLRDKVCSKVNEDARIYPGLVETISCDDESSVQALFEFVELADNTEIIYWELNVILGLVNGLSETRNDLMHSAKLEFEEGLIVTTANRPAREIPYRDLAAFWRKSRQALHVSSSLLVAGISSVSERDQLYSSWSNGSPNSRFLKNLYRDKINDLGSRWRDHLTAS